MTRQPSESLDSAQGSLTPFPRSPFISRENVGAMGGLSVHVFRLIAPSFVRFLWGPNRFFQTSWVGKVHSLPKFIGLQTWGWTETFASLSLSPSLLLTKGNSQR